MFGTFARREPCTNGVLGLGVSFEVLPIIGTQAAHFDPLIQLQAGTCTASGLLGSPSGARDQSLPGTRPSSECIWWHYRFAGGSVRRVEILVALVVVALVLFTVGIVFVNVLSRV